MIEQVDAAGTGHPHARLGFVNALLVEQVGLRSERPPEAHTQHAGLQPSVAEHAHRHLGLGRGRHIAKAVGGLGLREAIAITLGFCV